MLSVVNADNSVKEEAPSSDLESPMMSALIKVSDDFSGRLRVFTLMEQVNHLCRGVQRHRGFSMGLLAGNKSFLDNFVLLQQQVNRRIQLITAFVNQAPFLLNHTDVERLHFAWNTIRDNWQEDSVLENFEFHSHFIDQLLVMMGRLIEKVHRPYGIEIRALILQKGMSDIRDVDSVYYKLLFFSHGTLPRFIEILGKIRALSVHAAATGYCEKEYKKKLHYLLQCVAQEREGLFEVTAYLQASLIGQLPALLTIKTYEYKLDFLLKKMDDDFLEAETIKVKEEEAFNLVTDIIDIYWRVVDDSLNLLNTWQNVDLEQWLIDG